MAKRIFIGLILVILVAVVGLFALTWQSSIDPIDPPDRSAFDPALIAKGAQLASAGDCAVCHTREGGEPFAGGYALETPFGVIYGTNITPDPDTGIGRWSEEAFARAMRRGVDREGRHLYPGFPYPYFTRMTDDDIRAVYAYLMTRDPVHAQAPATELPFPFNMRMLMAGWNLLFLDTGRIEPDPAQSEEWNRGAYLAESVAHCGACHTPRNALGGEKKNAAYSGGVAEGWYAPALNTDAHALVPWTSDSLFAYLRNGFDEWHGAAFGPMAPVSRHLSRIPESELRAITTYITSVMGEPSPDRQKNAERLVSQAKGGYGQFAATTADRTRQGDRGAAIYAGACAACHESPVSSQGALPLTLSETVSQPEPRNLIQVIREGIHPAEGAPGPIMPGFKEALREDQMAELVNYLRSRFSEQPAWQDVDQLIAEVDRNGEHGQGQ